MADLSPDLTGKLGRLLPRLASDSPGEVNATVQAIRRTLDRAGLDLHDLAARLTEAPRPVQPEPPKRNRHAQRDGADLLAMAQWLRLHARDRLTAKPLLPRGRKWRRAFNAPSRLGGADD